MLYQIVYDKATKKFTIGDPNEGANECDPSVVFHSHLTELYEQIEKCADPHVVLIVRATKDGLEKSLRITEVL